MSLLETPIKEQQREQTHDRSSPLCATGRILVGLLLLFAAAMKGYELATAPVAGGSLLTTRWFLVAAVEFELLLGTLLLTGLLPKLTWWVSLLSFTAFAALTSHRIWLGETDCGCFGRLQLDPRITLAIDLAALAALAVARPYAATRVPLRPKPVLIVAALVLAVGVPGGWLMSADNSASVTDEGLVTAGNFIVLEPEKWVGKQFPLRDHIDIGRQFMAGKWIVILYSHTCSHCMEAMPQYLATARRLKEQGSKTQLALIQIPPIDQSEPGTAAAAFGSLSSQQEWFAETPVELQLEAGKVLRAVPKGNGLSWFSQME